MDGWVVVSGVVLVAASLAAAVWAFRRGCPVASQRVGEAMFLLSVIAAFSARIAALREGPQPVTPEDLQWRPDPFLMLLLFGCAALFAGLAGRAAAANAGGGKA